MRRHAGSDSANVEAGMPGAELIVVDFDIEIKRECTRSNGDSATCFVFCCGICSRWFPRGVSVATPGLFRSGANRVTKCKRQGQSADERGKGGRAPRALYLWSLRREVSKVAWHSNNPTRGPRTIPNQGIQQLPKMARIRLGSVSGKSLTFSHRLQTSRTSVE